MSIGGESWILRAPPTWRTLAARSHGGSGLANRIVAGLVAGACGSVALTAAASIDALIRGEAPRWLPGEVGHKMADELGLPLDYDLDAAESVAADPVDVTERISRREEALGTLLSLANRLAIGLAYGLVRKILPRPPSWLAGGVLGGVSMVAGDYSAIWTDEDSKPRRSRSDWLADVMPHAVYGVVTAVTFEATTK
jgi:hypothetical protein